MGGTRHCANHLRVCARRRALANTRFVSGDVHEAVDDGPFDAVIGRPVLMYVPDPSAVLHTQAAALRRGGIVAPIEFDLDTARTITATPLASRALTWVRAAFEQAGIQGALGPRLWQIPRGAGLKPVGMTSTQLHFGPDDPDGHALLAGIVRTLLPVIERTGVATAAGWTPTRWSKGWATSSSPRKPCSRTQRSPAPGPSSDAERGCRG
jgi:Methyltransferase domain